MQTIIHRQINHIEFEFIDMQGNTHYEFVRCDYAMSDMLRFMTKHNAVRANPVPVIEYSQATH